MLYKVIFSDSVTLLSLPETGMGYQIIKAIPSGTNDSRLFIVYNSEIIIDLDNEFPKYNTQLAKIEHHRILMELNTLEFKAGSIKVVKPSFIKENGSLHKFLKNFEKNSDDSVFDRSREHATGVEVFVRISFFEKDLRIDTIRNSLRPGSFTTTYEDYLDCVRIDYRPIERYALPFVDAFKWAYYILPKNTDVLQRGIANINRGKGIEAYFENGTSDKTFCLKCSYGEYCI